VPAYVVYLLVVHLLEDGLRDVVCEDRGPVEHRQLTRHLEKGGRGGRRRRVKGKEKGV
jgi:hypothetical protein